MKTTFGEIEIGIIFDFNIDADGYEPVFYKISETEAYQTHGRGAGLRKSFESDAEVYAGTERVMLHEQPTEVERAAIALLLGPRCQGPFVRHPGLHHYILALASDPGEIRCLDEYIFEADIVVEFDYDEDDNRIPIETAPLREVCQKRGFECWQHDYDRDHSASSAIMDNQPPADCCEERGDSYSNAWHDRNVFLLADSVQEYRDAGRPDGDQSHIIMGLGSPLMTVTTSLAAAIAEYHEREINRVIRMAEDY